MIPSSGDSVKVITEDGFKRGVCEVPEPETTENDYEPESLIEIDGEKKWHPHSKIYESHWTLEDLGIEGEIDYQEYMELVSKQDWDTDSDTCDNTDCDRDEDDKVKKVGLTEAFDGHIVEWCESCIERDNDMVDRVLN